MKPSLESLDQNKIQLFTFKEIRQDRFDAPYHFHDELELTLIISGEGKRFVGNQIADFGPGDLVLIGSNLPHCWQNHRSDWLNNEENFLRSQALVIHFDKNFLGETFMNQEECQSIKNLLERAKKGFNIQGPTQDKIARDMLQLNNLAPFPRLVSFLQMLYHLSIATADLQTIETQESIYAISKIDLERINRVYAYVIANYTQEVHLDEVAHLANMTETAFCRYFKKVTQKTFVELVTEFRIKHACQLLRTSPKSMVEICFESGFGNLSHFNKQFKDWMKVPPLQYRKLTKEWQDLKI
ncbi:AraC family transcriptional regulator [Aquirufa sp. ROCK2-A2]